MHHKKHNIIMGESEYGIILSKKLYSLACYSFG